MEQLGRKSDLNTSFNQKNLIDIYRTLCPATAEYTLFSSVCGTYTKIDHADAAAKSLQSCPTLCDPIDGSPPGSPIPGILQARILEWVAISFSNAWKWKVKVKSLSHAWPSATPWAAAFQAPPSMAFSRQEYWSEVPLPSPPEVATRLQKWQTL